MVVKIVDFWENSQRKTEKERENQNENENVA